MYIAQYFGGRLKFVRQAVDNSVMIGKTGPLFGPFFCLVQL